MQRPDPQQLQALVAGVEAAGRKVLAVYQRDFEVETKDDRVR